mgnify:CR=1 FL=1
MKIKRLSGPLQEEVNVAQNEGKDEHYVPDSDEFPDI